MYSTYSAFNLMWIFEFAWHVFNGIHVDDGENDNGDDFDGSRRNTL